MIEDLTGPDVHDRLSEVVLSLAPVEPPPIGDDLHLIGDLGFDSLGLLEVVSALEVEFGLTRVPEEEALAVETVGDLRRLLGRSSTTPRPTVVTGGPVTLFDRLLIHALDRPDDLAYAYLPDGVVESARLTWAGLHQRALALGAVLRERVAPGGRVLLVLPGGLDVVVAGQALFAAGLVGVPGAPPNRRRPQLGRALLERVAKDSGAALVLADRATAEVAADLDGLPCLVVDDVPHVPPASAPDQGWEEPAPGDLAYLQYTSGSTSEPRGVMLTHAHFAHNLAVNLRVRGVGPDQVMYSWLPPWHDLGLIFGIFNGAFSGFPTHLAPPTAIARRPVNWFRGLSATRATVTAGPDFMYRLAAAQAFAEPSSLEGVNLSALRTALDAAEPVRPSTLAALTGAFGPVGLNPGALCAAYGLAEATLVVTSTKVGEPPPVRRFSRSALAAGVARPLDGPLDGPLDDDAGDVVSLTGCGDPDETTRVAVVDPDRREQQPDGHVGEVWTSGPSVAGGYWLAERASEPVFRARIGTTPGRWLRTGDLGFQLDGHLFLSGRMKDVIIVNGVNHHANDLELAAQESLPQLATRVTAAFVVDDQGAAPVMVVMEAPEDVLAGESEAGPVLDAVRRGVASVLGAQPARVVLTDPRAIPRTTSGKVQRGRTRDALLGGELPVRFEWTARSRS